jgi:hypothetical protein
VLERLLKRIYRVRQNFQEKGSWFLLHISSAHSAREWWTLSNCGVVQISHQPYSYALALAVSFLFLQVKPTLSKWRWLQNFADSTKKVTALLTAVSLMNVFVQFFKTIQKVCCSQRELFVLGATAPQWARAFSFTRFLDQTQRRTTVGMTPLDELAAHRIDLYMTTHIKLTRETRPCPRGIRTHNLIRRAATELRLRTRDNWNLQSRGLLWK